MHKLLIAVPAYGGLSLPTHVSLLHAHQHTADLYTAHFTYGQTSALPFNFNRLLQVAYQSDFTHFLMLHSDIGLKNPLWVPEMLKIQAEEGVPVLSATVAIKSAEGLTSVAVDTREHFPRRLTLKEIHDGPETLTNEKCKRLYGSRLLINTGVMLWDLRVMRQHIPNLAFEFKDCWVNVTGQNGPSIEPSFFPEDWLMSRKLDDLGIPYATTRALETIHIGNAEYPSGHAWGNWETDKQWLDTQGKY